MKCNKEAFNIMTEICPEMYAIANIANIADRMQKSQISQNYSNEKLRNRNAEIADNANIVDIANYTCITYSHIT